ncbi:MAG: hypothetical protein ACK5LO_05195 [Leucobacter sp.]
MNVKSSRGSAVGAVLAAGPWVPLILLLVVAPLLSPIKIFIISTIGATAGIIGFIWTAVWIIRHSRRWLAMLRLAIKGTSADALEAAAIMVQEWPTLVHANGWVSKNALGQPPSLMAKLVGAITGNRAAVGPQIVSVRNAPAGPVAVVQLTPVCGAERIAAASESIADVWGAQSVEVVRPRAGIAEIRTRVRDPLAGTRKAFSGESAPRATDVSPDDFLNFGGDNA